MVEENGGRRSARHAENQGATRESPRAFHAIRRQTKESTEEGAHRVAHESGSEGCHSFSAARRCAIRFGRGSRGWLLRKKQTRRTAPQEGHHSLLQFPAISFEVRRRIQSGNGRTRIPDKQNPIRSELPCLLSLQRMGRR